MDKERIGLAVWEVLINNAKVDRVFVPNRDIPAAIIAALEEYESQQKEE